VSAVARCFQILLIASTLGSSWLTMMAVHELGHVLNAWASGGAVGRVVLHPLEFSRTDLTANPHPLVVAWGGAIWGCLIPLAVWGAMHAATKRYAFLARFFAGFCLIANGAYLAGGALMKVGDAADLLRAGAATWQLLAFGGATIPAGLYLCHRLGRKFALGHHAEVVDCKAAILMFELLMLLAGAELFFSH
jgi:hypothetical protein